MALLESRMGWLRMFAERLEAAPAEATGRQREEV
jgi:hypothetical protein